MAAYQDLEDVLTRAAAAKIDSIVSIGIDLDSSKAAVALAQRYENIFATVGVHPHDVGEISPAVYEELIRLHTDNRDLIVGYGEIGLDYVKNYSPKELQIRHFRTQLEVAAQLQLPVVIHNREADDDSLKLLTEAAPLTHGGIMHCFSGDYAYAKKILDLGMLISIPGIVTFKNAATLQEVAQKIPLTSLVLETDGPFLAPHPFRGKRNEPALLVHTAEKVAALRKIDLCELAHQTSLNATRIFSLDQRS